MLKRLLCLVAFLLATIFVPAHAAIDCGSGSFAAAASCDSLLGQWTIAVLPNSSTNASAGLFNAGETGDDPPPATGTIRVSRNITRDCGAGCQSSEELPSTIEVTLKGIFIVNAGVLAYEAPPSGEDNIYVHGSYSGPGSLEFGDYSYAHNGNGQSAAPFHREDVTDTVDLAPGEYSFTLDLEGLARLDGQGPGNWSSFASSLSLQASIADPNFEIPCTPIPEPETYALMLAGLGAIVLRRRTANTRKRTPVTALTRF